MTSAHPLASSRSRRRPTLSRCSCALLALGLIAPPPLWAQAAPPRAGNGAPALAASTPVTLNFVNADIDAVSRAMGAMLGRSISVDPRVRGTITVYSEQPLTVREAYLSYLAALRGLGFTVVENAGLLKVVPEADAKLQTGTVSIGAPTARGDMVMTQIFRLNYENPNNLVAVLRPLISPNNTINANPSTSSLVITDYADNLQRIAKIIAALDQPGATDVDVVPLRYAVAADLAVVAQRLADGSATAGVPGAAPTPVVAGGASGTQIVADSRSNSLIVRAPNAARLGQVRALIEKLDVPPTQGLPAAGPAGHLWVVHLKNADATKLATVLRAAFAGAMSTGAAGGGAFSGAPVSGTAPRPTPQPASTTAGTGAMSAAAATPVAESAGPSVGGFIQADPSTNSLIITAPEPLYRQIRAMIEQLDTRRAQVYIESLIVEVKGDKAADFGFQWQGLLGNNGDKYGAAAGTNFGTQGNILAITAAQATGSDVAQALALPAGLNFALLRNYGGTYALAAIANMLQSQTNTNIVSTPNLITLDNEEAKIVVGSNVPFVTGQFTNTGVGAVTNPFQTIERQDVGLTLRIRPQIGEGGTVRMTIYQEASQILQRVAPGTSNAGPSTSKRSIESTVVVDDGAILVLGGLIEDRYEETRSQVPLLGDIPVIGELFRSQSRTKERTNLMVFLRPVIMRDAATAERLSLDRYDMMRAQQQQSQPAPSVVLPINQSPVLPPLNEGPVQTLPVPLPSQRAVPATPPPAAPSRPDLPLGFTPAAPAPTPPTPSGATPQPVQ